MMTPLALLSNSLFFTLLTTTFTLVHGLQYDAREADYNLNTNKAAQHPLDYSGEKGGDYNPSPKNWRVPFYTLFLDRFVNGNPENDNANGTNYETDMMSTQLRFGGDLEGLVDSLDYLEGMGIKGIYLAGSPFINQPWGADSYSPIDLTLLDKHFGDLKTWQHAIHEIHLRNMSVLMDNTMATMGDLIGFKGYLNESTPFQEEEHEVVWKSEQRYPDFNISNEYKDTCKYPVFWYEDGTTIKPKGLKGCYDSDFDQYGDVEAFGVFPDWMRQLSKFASVQDRLREWNPSVLDRLKHFSCMTIAQLDIDGFRIDKAVQVTVDAQAEFSSHMRECAAKYGKDNFLVVGEITSGDTLGSIYLGRGREPKMAEGLTALQAMSPETYDNDKYYVREKGNSALDAGAFHYSIYRYMTRFMGLSGNLEAGFDLPTDWVGIWNRMLQTNDFINVNTGQFDPRHLFGASNQDVFRWPTIELGIERQLLATMITTLLLPGAPLLYYGEEQALYLLDGTAENYIYARQSFAPSPAWKAHGCFSLNSTIYVDFPFESGRDGCKDEKAGLDHRDPSAPIRNIMKHMFALRDEVRVLDEGWYLQTLSNKTYPKLLPGSGNPTEFGIWSILRGLFRPIQNGTDTAVWFVYHNEKVETAYTFDCSNPKDAFIAPFAAGIRVRDLFSERDAITLEDSAVPGDFEGKKSTGCISELTLKPYEFRVYVPVKDWVKPAPMITKIDPSHDSSIRATAEKGSFNVTVQFNVEMDCESLTTEFSALLISDGMGNGTKLNFETPNCGPISKAADKDRPYTGFIPSAYEFRTRLLNVPHGIVKLTINKPKSADGLSTNAVDHFLVRHGYDDNPIVFPSANYSRSLFEIDGAGKWWVNHRAAGATRWRYSTNWASTWSPWTVFDLGKPRAPISNLVDWKGTPLQEWKGNHLMVQYFSKPLGTSAILQHSDSDDVVFDRAFPHIRLHGPYNKWGYDAGLPGSMDLIHHHKWSLHYMYEWPASFQLNIWGINQDNQPDVGSIFGDIDLDGVVDRLPPSSLANNVINITEAPPMPALAYKVVYNDATWSYHLEPTGSVGLQVLLFILLAVMPVLLASIALWIYVGSFYQVKINKSGFAQKGWRPLKLGNLSMLDLKGHGKGGVEMSTITPPLTSGIVPVGAGGGRRTVLIATMEYNIDDFDIKIKIGGLGVMAQLMAASLSHLDLVWVVPMVGDVHYPTEKMEAAEPMFVDVMGQPYEIQVYYHVWKNITYVILDAPIFRKQTRADPYIARMDDLESAILYAAWNYCIAESIRRFPVDLYHINDYHGAAAPLYLLPQTIPCCLSLHNAEFQGMWPMRTPAEQKEVCEVFNLPPEVVKDYVRYGSVFNLLHAGASYLRLHQRGFGAVGVSRKYGDRSLARYPIFWSLKTIGQLPNPDPSDTADWNPDEDVSNQSKTIEIDQSFEEKRAGLRQQAQEWAGLEVDPTAELFVFVGRWSLQKGVDLIADIFPSILEKYPKTQLICIGPVVDLYGRFAALKLEKLMQKYPKRVFSKPEFTQLPPYIFSGAEFALIPSRDEPFGLVAVEFGRKGALGVGARVGGLGQMPGFWFTVESMSPSHLLQQFRQAIGSALDCKTEKRKLMRAWSAKQRFPVAQWVKQLDELHNQSIRVHMKEAKKKKNEVVGPMLQLTRPPSRASNFGAFHDAQSPAPDSGRISPAFPGQSRPTTPTGLRDLTSPTLQAPLTPWAAGSKNNSPRNSTASSLNSVGFYANQSARDSTVSIDSFAVRAQNGGMASPSIGPDGGLGFPQPAFMSHRNSSLLSLPDVVGDRQDLKLQQVDQIFNDTSGEYYAEFDEMLEAMSASNSTGDLCIENFLKKSEKEWFARYREAKLGRVHDSTPSSRAGSRPPSRNGDRRNESVASRGRQRHRSLTPGMSVFEMSPPPHGHLVDDEFLLGDGFRAPTGLRKILSIRIGDWPVYSFLLALGQIISVNSYQIVLLTGDTSQTPEKLYMTAATYMVTSIAWWGMERNFQSVYALSAPWVFFGLSFFLLGIAPFISPWQAADVVEDVATCLYAAGASSGALSFSLNFGDEGGAPTKQWITRALVVSGVAQVYSLALWYWGSLVANRDTTSTIFVGGSNIPQAIVICVPFAIVFWAIGIVLFLGLPDFYRQSPAQVPGFYISLYRRKIVPWFFVMVILQNYWLSAQYGRTWQFLFASQYIPGWGVFVLALGFLLGLWSLVLFGFSHFSEEHTWLLPVFAIGLCAPRWAQEFWATSGIAWYIPWAGSPLGSAVLSRCLWLWLGLLDNIQGVGLGMMLLATLTRQHVMVVLLGAQVVGSAFTMLARATSPNALTPNTTFPDFTQGIMPGIASKWFWVCLLLQLIIPVGFFKFFRKEQVSKP